MEKRDLYDRDRNLIGKTIYKGEKIPKNCYIVVVLVFIQNNEGKFLIQKRSKIKGGRYGSTGGHLETGENSIQGLLRETKEEINLDIDPNKLQLYYSGINDTDGIIWDDYYLKMDIPNIQNLKLQKEEVEGLYWFTTEEIEKLMKNKQFLEDHYEDFEILVNWLDKK